MLFALCFVLTLAPFAGAVQDQNNQNTNTNNADDELNPGVTGDEANQVKTLLQENKPFGAGTDEILGSANSNELKLGATGDQVKEIQQWLYDYGYYAGDIDGNFGEGTDKAVRIFQEEAGLLVDGEVGEETKKAMEKWDQYLAQVQAYSESQSVSTSSPTSSPRSYARALRTAYSYSGGRGSGDCWDNSAALYNRLTSSGSQARIIQYATSQSSRHRSVQVYKDGKWVNYDYKANGYAQTYYATSNSVNGVVVKG